MPDKPVIFSAPMVRALLDGRKTQTRRVLKPQPSPHVQIYRVGSAWDWRDGTRGGSVRVPCTPGDRLWVREALDLGDLAYPIGHATYAADRSDVDLRPEGAAAWAGDYKRQSVPSIHMPRWASRLTLTVTEVRVQRLQQISEADAVAEGVTDQDVGGARGVFSRLWNSLHGSGAWDANPWVCAMTFTVYRCNIDALEAP